MTEKNGENVRLVFLQDYLLMSAWLSPMLTHVVLPGVGGATVAASCFAGLVPLQKLA